MCICGREQCRLYIWFTLVLHYCNVLNLSEKYNGKNENKPCLGTFRAAVVLGNPLSSNLSMSLSMPFHQKSPYGSTDRANFTFSEFGPRKSLDRRHMAFGNPFRWVFWISMCVQNLYPNIPYGSKVMGNFHVFYSLDFGKTSTNGHSHFAIPWARSCQYQWACDISSNYSIRFKRQGQFHLFRIWTSAKPRPMKYGIWIYKYWGLSCKFS